MLNILICNTQQLRDISSTCNTIQTHIVLDMVEHSTLIRYRDIHAAEKATNGDRVAVLSKLERAYNIRDFGSTLASLR